MSITLNRPWTKTTYRGSDKLVTNTNGTKADVMTDNRSALQKTPRAKWRPPRPYSRSIEEGYVKGCNLAGKITHADSGIKPGSYTSYAGFDNFSGFYYDALPPFPSNLQTKAEINALLKLKNFKDSDGIYQSVDLGTAIGEREQTAKLCAQTLRRIVKGVRAAKRLDARGLAKALGVSTRGLSSNAARNAFSLWLEYQYGWKPLLSDVWSSCELLRQREGERDEFVTKVVSKAKDKDSVTDTRATAVFNNCQVWVTKLSKIEHECKVRLDYFKANNAAIADLTEAGITNPLSVAWELVPFSFVVDWFTPIGDWLSSLNAAFGWDFRGGSCSKRTYVAIKPYTERLVNTSSYSMSGYVTASGSGRQFNLTRTVYDTSPLPRAPYSKFKAGSTIHVANGIALLGSLFMGGSKVK
jgi:hypothetical protein